MYLFIYNYNGPAKILSQRARTRRTSLFGYAGWVYGEGRDQTADNENGTIELATRARMGPVWLTGIFLECFPLKSTYEDSGYIFATRKE